MGKAGPSTRAISPAPLALSAATLPNRGGRSGSRGGGEAGTAAARPAGVRDPHLRSLPLLVPPHGGRRRPPEPHATHRSLSPPGSAEPQASRRGSQAAEHRSEQEVGACLPSSQMQKWRRSFLSINNRQLLAAAAHRTQRERLKPHHPKCISLVLEKLRQRITSTSAQYLLIPFSFFVKIR